MLMKLLPGLRLRLRPGRQCRFDMGRGKSPAEFQAQVELEKKCCHIFFVIVKTIQINYMSAEYWHVTRKKDKCQEKFSLKKRFFTRPSLLAVLAFTF